MSGRIRAVCVVAIVLMTALCVVAQDTRKDNPPSKVKPISIEQLFDFGHALYRASNMNVINGLNLSREQAVELRDMAAELEEANERTFSASYDDAPELGEARKVFDELLGVLVKGGEVPKDVYDKVLKARTVESEAIRAGLVLPPRKSFEYGECERCHIPPGEERDAADAGKGGLELYSAVAAQEAAFAHTMGAYDKKALVKVALFAKRIDNLLTDSQKEVFSGFSCCLVPPKGMSDPVRVGQAAMGDWELDLMRKVRKIEESAWPASKDFIISALARAAVVKNPGLTAQDKKELSERAGAAMNKARAMSDSEFELGKEELCAALHDGKKPELPAQKKAFMQAFFLLQLGSVEAYDELIKRIDGAKPAEHPAEK